jgi:hypothetical protein
MEGGFSIAVWRMSGVGEGVGGEMVGVKAVVRVGLGEGVNEEVAVGGREVGGGVGGNVA